VRPAPWMSSILPVRIISHYMCYFPYILLFNFLFFDTEGMTDVCVVIVKL
jgi:hypothetical protein